MDNKVEHDLAITNSIEINENIQETTSLFSGKKFPLWEVCETFINKWAKRQGFCIVKDCVV
jgi:hypothetical protein